MKNGMQFRELSEALRPCCVSRDGRVLLSVNTSNGKVGGMRSMWRTLSACMVCGLVGLMSWSAVARAEEASLVPGSGSSVFSNPTVVVGSPEEAQELQYEHESKLDSPEAVSAREASQTKFEGLNPEQAGKLAGESFPQIVDVPAGGSPQLPVGERIVTYPTTNTAELELPNGKGAVLESLSPIAIETSSSTRIPLDLALSETADHFQPARGLVDVEIPKRLAGGISLPEQGVSLTPSDAQGRSLVGSEGSPVGASVLYANTQLDTDTLVKPTTIGFDVDALLRSAQGPERLYFRVGMPVGAALVSDGQDGARVTVEGQTIASILPPKAQDAAESSVPVSMSVSGDLLVVSVDHRVGSYEYPIDVDPSIIDTQLAKSGAKRANWEFNSEPSGSTKFGHTNAVCKGPGEQYLETCATGEYKAGEFAVWIYQTRGNSKIFEFKGETEAENTSAKIESAIELQSSAGLEEKEQLSTELKEPKYAKRALPEALCPKGKTTCTSSYGGEKNAVHFQQSVTGTGSKFSDYLYTGEVSITEPEEHATTRFNTGSLELEGEVINGKGEKEKIKRKNVLDSGGWLSEHDGAAELISEDKGIGVSATQLEYENSPGKWEQIAKHNYLNEEDLCKGYQCEPKDEEFWVDSPKLANGEDKIRYRAEDGMGPSTESTESEGVATVKVDTSKPRKLKIGGLPYGNELSERPYQLTVGATDGEGTTIPSSGIESIAFYIDGGLIGTNGGTGGKEGTEGKCSEPKGECTASAKWTFNGAELGAGRHQIEIVARDRAGNEERFYDPISIRHSTPVSMGPGSVDLESGDFSLGSTDVSMGSGLSVSRGYSSRALQEGDEGPLGPQWSVTVGGSAESLVELVDHAMMLTGSNGRQTIFAKTETNTYESPVGDSNLTLTLEENKETKVKEAFYLEDAADHTKVKFTLPSGGTKVWVPTRQEGAVATDTVTGSYQTVGQHAEYPVPSGSSPYAITTGPDGRLWFVDRGTSKIGKITSTGFIVEYSLPSGSAPCAITRGPDENVWFTDCGTGKVGKITTTGVITEYSLPAGSEPTGITEGFDGKLWVANHSLKAIDKIETSGVLSVEYKEGVPSGPEGITRGPDGRIWFTAQEGGKGKFGAITTSGSIENYPVVTLLTLKPKQIVAGPEGDLWATEEGNTNLDRITTSGGISQWSSGFGAGGESGITLGPDRNLWLTAAKSSKILKVTPPVGEGKIEVSEYAEPEGSEPWAITEGPEHNLWYTDLKSNKIAMITTTGTVTRPTEALAPVPAKVECPVGKLQPGCRALKFVYATETTAKGESESEWGDYTGHLKQVLFEAYNPESKKVEEPGVPVAEYKYDQLGRLRSEWDPRTSSLKTTYGYDEEGHLTGLEQPGQEPWLFTYGTTAGDTGSGRLLALTRPSVSTSVSINPKPVLSEAPKLSSTSPVQGLELSTTAGKWSNSPGSYSYQWERCSTSSGACSVITGATNPSYVPSAADVEDKLLVQVSAVNNGGTTTTLTAISGKVVQLPTYSSQFGSLGSGNGQMKSPAGIAMDSSGDLWVADTANHRIQEFSSTGSYLAQFGSEGTGNGQFKEPDGIAIDAKNNIWVSDQANNNVQEFNEKHEWVRTVSSWKLGKFPTETTITLKSPRGLAVDATGNVWVAEGGKTVIEFSETGEYVRGIGEWTVEIIHKEAITNPGGVAIDPSGDIWVADTSNNRVVEFSSTGSYMKQFGTAGTGAGQFKEPKGIAITKEGYIWVADTLNDRMQKFNSTGEYIGAVGSLGTGNGQFTEPRSTVLNAAGSMWVADTGNNRVQKFVVQNNTNPPPPPALGSSAVTTLEYGVPLTAGSGLPAMTSTEVAKWGQNDDPVEATAILPPDSPQGWPASSYARATTYYLDEQGRVVNVETPSNGKYGSISTTEYNEENDATRTLTPDNRATALEAGEKSAEVATLLSAFSTYKNKCSRESEFNEERESAEFGTRLCETEGPEHLVKYTGVKGIEEGEARDHVRYFYDEKVPAEGPNKEPFSKETFNLLTEQQNLTEILGSKGRVEEEIEPRTTITSYSGQNNLGWKLRAPTSVTTDSETGGQKLKSETFYNEAGQVTETRSPSGEAGTSAHDAKIVYYTSENEAEVASCRKHPEWTGLVCETLPAKQPETSGVPNLPVTETTYNMWDEPETATETFAFSPHPTSVRTRKDTYDTAGRLTSSETTVTGNEDKTLPKVTYEYEPKQGILDAESATIGGKAKTVTNKFNTLGQLTEYADASGENTAKYTYGGPAKDLQVEEANDSSNVAKSRQTYTYNKNTMQLETLSDSAAETFTAAYDTEGKLTSETYPNGMCANYTYNSIGEATHLEYIKTTNCSEKTAPVWYSETIGSTVRGETLNRTSTLATENYAYDTLGRLTEAQETPAGGECSVRLYEYEKESNRIKLTSRKPGTKGECATAGGAEEKHTYDEANRMTDTGVEYEGLGNIAKLPAADAEGHELKSTFYVDGAVASQTQNSVTNEYGLDPAGRVLTTATGGKTMINHYDGSGETVAWACEAATGTETCETGKWTRNIPGIDGALAAIQTNGGTPVLQLHDLKGNVIATAELSSGATKLLSTYNSTEFGVPNKEKTPPPFAWLGAADISKSLSSGVITYGATSYVPQTGRTLQSVPVQSPGYPAPIGGGTYASFVAEPWNMQGGERAEAEAPGIAATEQHEAEGEALRKAIGEEQDPVFHYTAAVAKEKAQELADDLAAGNILDAVAVFFGSLDEAAERAIKALWSHSFVAEWATEVEEYLGFCVDTLHSDKDSHGGCRVLFYDMGWEGSDVPNFFEKPVVSYCLKMTSNTVEVHECTLEKFESEVHVSEG